MKANMETGPPAKGRHFYTIIRREDGLIDVYLNPRVFPISTEDGITDYDVSVTVVRGIEDYDGIEEDIRARFQAWCESGEVIYL